MVWLADPPPSYQLNSSRGREYACCTPLWRKPTSREHGETSHGDQLGVYRHKVLRSKKVARLPGLVKKLHGINQNATVGYDDIDGRELVRELSQSSNGGIDEELAESGSLA